MNFKVKTTAPKRYYVRPNAATLEPGATIAIEGVASLSSPAHTPPTRTPHFVPERDPCVGRAVVLQQQEPEELGIEPGVPLSDVNKKRLQDKFLLQARSP